MTPKPLHRITNADPETRLATCEVCGPNTRAYRNKKTGYWYCMNMMRQSVKRWGDNLPNYRKKIDLNRCNRCGFIPQDPIQMDVHHMDGNHYNSSQENLEALCANCHRLTYK